MKIARSADYPAGVEQVMDVIRQVAFQEEKCTATQATHSEATVEESAGRVVVRTVRTLPTDGLPDVVAQMVGGSLVITEVQAWGPAAADGTRVAELTITAAKAPVSMHGRITLSPLSAGCHEAVAADLTAAVPLFGSRIEKAAAPMIEEAIDREVATVHSWLTR